LSRPTKKGPWFVRVSEIDPVAIAAVVVRPSPDSHPKTRAVAPMVHRDRYCDAPGADDGSCASRRPGVQRQYRRRTGNPGANYPDLCRGSAKRFDIHDHYCRSAPRLLILMARIRAKPLRRVTSLLGNRGLQPGRRVEFGMGVITHASNIVEHPQMIAERIMRFARLAGRENVSLNHPDAGQREDRFAIRVTAMLPAPIYGNGDRR